MERRPSRVARPAGAGAVLLGTTVAGIGVGALVGWLAGAWPIGALVGALVSIPAGIFAVYRRYAGVLVRDVWATPRPIPNRLVPVAGGAAVVALALPVFVAAGWPLRGWALGAILWLCAQALGVLLSRLQLGADNLAASRRGESG